MNAISSFTFHNDYNIRLIDLNGEIWFVATDIASALDYRNAPDMTRSLDDDEAATHIMRIRSENGVEQDRPMTIINESGLYSAILKSRKPEAKKFKKWVTSEVLPAIRKTGKYEAPKPVVTPNYVTANDMENIKRLVWHCSSFMDYEEVFSRAVWYALRDKVGVKSPEAFKVEDLPLLGEEFNRIIHIIQPYLKARREAEKQLISRLIRGRGDYEPIMKDILYHMRDSVEEQIKNTRVQANGIFKRDFNALIERKAVC